MENEFISKKLMTSYEDNTHDKVNGLALGKVFRNCIQWGELSRDTFVE